MAAEGVRAGCGRASAERRRHRRATTCTRASQRRRWAVTGASTCPASASALGAASSCEPSASRVWASTWTTTRGAVVIRVGRPSGPSTAARGRRPFEPREGARRAPGSMSSGRSGMRSARRVSASSTVAPWSAGSCASMPTCRPIGRRPAAKPTVTLGLRHLASADDAARGRPASRPPRRSAHAPTRPVVALSREAANRQSSTTWSMPSRPDANALAVSGNDGRLRAASTHLAGLPHGDAVADRDPVAHVFGALIAPGFAAVGLGQQPQQFEMGAAERRPHGVGPPQELPGRRAPAAMRSRPRWPSKDRDSNM